jgi:hypothetical protein
MVREAFTDWAFRMAEIMVINVAVSTVPAKVPATPSFEVKPAVTTEAIPAAIVSFVSTTFCDFSSVITARWYQPATLRERYSGRNREDPELQREV